jgi:hypothetical protein
VGRSYHGGLVGRLGLLSGGPGGDERRPGGDDLLDAALVGEDDFKGDARVDDDVPYGVFRVKLRKERNRRRRVPVFGISPRMAQRNPERVTQSWGSPSSGVFRKPDSSYPLS